MNGNIDQLLETGFAAHCAGNLPHAMLAYSGALAQAPDHVSALALQMAAAQDLNDWVSARQYLERLAPALGRNPAGLVLLARLFCLNNASTWPWLPCSSLAMSQS